MGSEGFESLCLYENKLQILKAAFCKGRNHLCG